jgi:hypothetical protein
LTIFGDEPLSLWMAPPPNPLARFAEKKQFEMSGLDFVLAIAPPWNSSALLFSNLHRDIVGDESEQLLIAPPDTEKLLRNRQPAILGEELKLQIPPPPQSFAWKFLVVMLSANSQLTTVGEECVLNMALPLLVPLPTNAQFSKTGDERLSKTAPPSLEVEPVPLTISSFRTLSTKRQLRIMGEAFTHMSPNPLMDVCW